MIKVGCCGWGFYRGGLEAYQRGFSVVEIQQTFYKLPRVKTAQRWKACSKEGFEFVVKAWQAITHLPASPTWRRSGLKPEELRKRQYGWLRPTRDNFDAWGRTREICEAVGARVCVIQTPPNFNCTEENMENMQKFLESIDPGRLALAWEPRGDWREHKAEVRKICRKLKLIHVVDLMRREPLSEHPIAYIRLHGLNPKEYDYNYNYSPAELRELARRSRALERKHREVYIMFNNFKMYENAGELQKLLSSK